MKKLALESITCLLIVLLVVGCTQEGQTVEKVEKGKELFLPWEELNPLFHDVQMASIFPDSKTFVDCVPMTAPSDILQRYEVEKAEPNFDLSTFVNDNFIVPSQASTEELTISNPFEEHLMGHWDYLTREGQQPGDYSSLIALPEKYVVPGGRFREIYYWDSYFTMIGLGASGRVDLVKSMLDNFKYEVETIGFIPNGNRTYFLGRSQPPFFGAMIYLYAQYTSTKEASQYLEALQKEYNFWMEGADKLTVDNPAHRRVVKVGDYIINRYYDDQTGPRPESYKEDVELAHGMTDEARDQLYLDLRAACESGWDFSARWFAEGTDFSTIETTLIAPVDLNSILYHTEFVLSELYLSIDEQEESRTYLKKAENRYEAINQVFWNDEAKMYMDFHWKNAEFTGKVSAASFYPMYFKVAQSNYASEQTAVLLDQLLTDGGVLTSTLTSGQQWDAPNGWAPLQWVAFQGLNHYGFEDQAESLRTRWLSVNKKVFSVTGKMMEKYNVADTTLLAGGGEYPTQDGFGWTNGIALGMLLDDVKY
ncbi:MAG: alpha,alpha-trehalase [Cyclobacteriaceae bacterium]|jgi:alpha,alpha-trehalase